MNSKSYSIAKLKAGLSSIVREVAGGREVVVTDHNKAVARIVPVSRVPPLPHGEVSALFATPPVKLRPGSPGSAQIVSALRDAE